MTAISIHTHRTDLADAGERGREYGTLWARQIHTAVAEYGHHFTTVGINTAQARRVSEECGEQIRTTMPYLAEEIEGIAAGADTPLWQVMMLNARTEILALAPPVEECSAATYWPRGAVPHTLQTWDWRPGLAQSAVVSAFPTSNTGTRVVTFAEFGQVGKIGVNSHGLGLHFNILRHGSDGSRPGVPVHVAARYILDVATTVSEATELARSLRFGASSAFTVASREGAVRTACLEVTPEGVGVIEGREGAALSHTNHFLDPDLAAGAKRSAPGSTSPARLSFLHANERALSITDPVARISALADEPDVPICARRSPELPEHEDSVTKATIALDLQAPALGIHAGGPRDVQATSWQTVAVPARPAGALA